MSKINLTAVKLQNTLYIFENLKWVQFRFFVFRCLFFSTYPSSRASASNLRPRQPFHGRITFFFHFTVSPIRFESNIQRLGSSSSSSDMFLFFFLVCVSVCVCMCVCVYVCMCVWKREREIVRERGRDKKREYVLEYVCLRERRCVCE